MEDDIFSLFHISPITHMRSDLVSHAMTWQHHAADFKEIQKRRGPLEDDPTEPATKLVAYRHEYMALSLVCDLWDTVPKKA